MMTRKQKLAIVAVAALVGPCVALAQPPAAAPGAAGRGPAAAGAPAAPAGATQAPAAVLGYQPTDAAGNNVAIPPREVAADNLENATPANRAAGIYRGKITSGPDAGTELSLWVIRAKDDTVRLMPSRLVIDDQDLKVKFDGGPGTVVQADGDVQLRIDASAEPKKLEYKYGNVAYTAELAQTLGVDF